MTSTLVLADDGCTVHKSIKNEKTLSDATKHVEAQRVRKELTNETLDLFRTCRGWKESQSVSLFCPPPQLGVNQIFNTSDSDEYSEETSDIDDTIPWIDWFISIDENEVFVEVDSDYIRDTFNLTGLRNSVKHFDRALRIILDLANHFDESHDDRDKSGSDSSVYQASSAMEEVENLYGLIHARYILMHKGMEIMREKYKGKVFGTCPNISCAKQPVLPIGLSNKLGVSNAKVFCPCCNEIYVPSIPRLGTVDGAFFGTSFAHLFFLYYPDLVVTPRETYYVPKLFGFKVWPGVRDALRERFVLPEENKIVEKRKKENSSQVPASVMDDVRSL